MAVAGRTDVCRYAYCRNVLQRHWEMCCNHGALALPEAPSIHDQVVMHEDNTLELLKKTLK
jgi:hypothetical protein